MASRSIVFSLLPEYERVNWGCRSGVQKPCQFHAGVNLPTPYILRQVATSSSSSRVLAAPTYKGHPLPFPSVSIFWHLAPASILPILHWEVSIKIQCKAYFCRWVIVSLLGITRNHVSSPNQVEEPLVGY